MPKYEVTYRVIESWISPATPFHTDGSDHTYKTTVEANTPEEAGNKVQEEQEQKLCPTGEEYSGDVYIENVEELKQ